MKETTMIKRFLTISILLFSITACSGGRGDVYDIGSELVERGPSTQSVQFSPNQLLPPYGIQAIAQVATLELQISSKQRDPADRIQDIQKAIEAITVLAADTETISLAQVSVNQVGGSYPREEGGTPTVQNLDTSAIILALETNLSQHDYDLVKTVVEFNDFLDALDLPDTITVQALSVETELDDVEGYRNQIIAQVYQELDAVQKEYGQGVKFEITGLYDPVKQIQLSDIEYYVYLEPVVIVREF